MKAAQKLKDSGDLDGAVKELESVQKHKLSEKMSQWKEIEHIRQVAAEKEKERLEQERLKQAAEDQKLIQERERVF